MSEQKDEFIYFLEEPDNSLAVFEYDKNHIQFEVIIFDFVGSINLSLDKAKDLADKLQDFLETKETE